MYGDWKYGWDKEGKKKGKEKEKRSTKKKGGKGNMYIFTTRQKSSKVYKRRCGSAFRMFEFGYVPSP
jgi:hypothetical protein